jgi:hypothetical protein
MISTTSALPAPQVNVVSRMRVFSRYRRAISTVSVCGRIRQTPLSSVPSIAAMQADESKRGRQRNSMAPSRAISAAERPSPIRA